MKEHKDRISLSKGSHAPITHTPWQRSQEKLSLSKSAIELMNIAKDRVTYEREWNNFVDAIEESWSSFYEEGKRISTKFQPWAG